MVNLTMENRMVDTQKFIKMNGTWYKKYKKNNFYLDTEEVKFFKRQSENEKAFTRFKLLQINQKKRADKLALKYKEDLANYNKVMLDNDDLKRVNNELNIMQTRTLEKVLYLGNENRNLKNKIKKLSK